MESDFLSKNIKKITRPLKSNSINLNEKGKLFSWIDWIKFNF